MKPEHRELWNQTASRMMAAYLGYGAQGDYRRYAEWSVKSADALIAELERREAEDLKVEEPKGESELPSDEEVRRVDAEYTRKVEAENERLKVQLAEAKAIIKDAPDHSDVDACLFDNNFLRAENERLKAKNKEMEEYMKGFEPFKTWAEGQKVEEPKY